jgi:hypothetical protein
MIASNSAKLTEPDPSASKVLNKISNSFFVKDESTLHKSLTNSFLSKALSPDLSNF